MTSPADAIPVTLLTGFLGSGKTTLLNDLLRDLRMRNTAIVVNEFGSISVDHDLVHVGREQYVVTSTGCLCCTATSDIRTSLFELHEASRRGDTPAFVRAIIETTGLADPAPIVNSLIPGGAPASGLRDHAVARSFRLSGVITTFDAVFGEATLKEHLEGWKQIAVADHLVLTKMDIADASPQNWRERLRAMNPAARLHDRHAPGFDLAALIGSGFYNATDKAEDVLGWLAMDQIERAEGHDHAHPIDRNGDHIQALALTHDEPLEPRAVEEFLTILTEQKHAGLLRLKGILALTDDPGRPLVVHAIQHRLYPSLRLDYWPSADVRSRLIIIGKDLPLQPIQRLFDTLVPRTTRNRRGRCAS